MLPPFLNGRAVFATKHALALAHASGGGKCKRRVPYPECKWRAPQAVCTSAARKIRVPLVARQRRSLSAGLVFSLCAERVDVYVVVFWIGSERNWWDKVRLTRRQISPVHEIS
jgi:hypothetical protein